MWRMRRLVDAGALGQRRSEAIPRRQKRVLAHAYYADKVRVIARRFCTFNVVDDCNRDVVHIEVDTSITSIRLKRIFQQRGVAQVSAA